jgi:hypothetical protein
MRREIAMLKQLIEEKKKSNAGGINDEEIAE